MMRLFTLLVFGGRCTRGEKCTALGVRYGAVAVVFVLLATQTLAAPHLASRVNFACWSLRDAGDLAVINDQRNTDAMLELVRANRCFQVQTSGPLEPRELLVLERAERADGSAFLRVRLYLKKPTVTDRRRPDSVDVWFPERDIAGTFPDVPTRDYDEATR